jgi:phosphoenolpyruvate phosphomutase
VTKEFMVIARIESLILEAGMDDALERAFAYVEAGADGIMIHSRLKDPAEIIEFVTRFREGDKHTPVVVVPTSFNSVTTDEFKAMGVNVVIYANHMLRAAYPGMMQVAKSILKNKRSLEAEPSCMPIKEILELIPGTK